MGHKKYQDKIIELFEKGKIPKAKLSFVEVAHDDDTFFSSLH